MWRIAAPMILSNISVPLLGMVDTGVTGHLDSSVYLGAVAIGAMIFSFLYTGVNFLRMGTTGITAQSFGADDNDGLRVALGQALIVA
ncbi:MAG: MATE family efflux transporter, partial [Gammaproteobacteria bacterium]|nr:MATE family efflux transporter [Gammaproteobacteria bacterium]